MIMIFAQWQRGKNMRLIDADELKLSHCKECTLYPNKCMGKDCDWESIAHINMMPTIDAVPARHAKLINAHPYGECSCCGELIDSRDKFRYCPNCGAIMDERKEE